MTPLSELIARLERNHKDIRCSFSVYADAAKALREMAADFDRWAKHGPAECEHMSEGGHQGECSLDRVREKWRLSE